MISDHLINLLSNVYCMLYDIKRLIYLHILYQSLINIIVEKKNFIQK